MKRYVAAWCFLDDICKILCCFFWDYSEQARNGTVVWEVFLNENIFIKKRGVAAWSSFGDLWEKQMADFGNKNQKVRGGTVVLDDFWKLISSGNAFSLLRAAQSGLIVQWKKIISIAARAPAQNPACSGRLTCFMFSILFFHNFNLKIIFRNFQTLEF